MEREQAVAAPSTAVFNANTANLRPFSESVALHIGWRDMPVPLRGSLELLQRQDDRLEAAGLKRIETEAQLSASIQQKLLVPIPVSTGLTVNGNLKANHRYVRPWTAQFLTDLAQAHEALFHGPLEVTSAVRPASYQARLERINGNAAPANGDIFSPHMMGATIDIGKHGLSRREMAWMRINLLTLEQAGKIDVEEEFHQSCFHITVYPNYMPGYKGAPATKTAANNSSGAASHDSAAPAAALPVTELDNTPKDNGSAPLQQDNSTGS